VAGASVLSADPTAPRFAASLSQHPVPAHGIGEAAADLLDALGGDDPDLLVCFISPHLVGALDDMAGALASIFDPRVAIAMTTAAVFGGSREIEDGPAVSLFAAILPGARLTPVSLRTERSDDGPTVMGWPERDVIDPRSALFLLADPFSFPADGFLRALHAEHPDLRVVGGAASAARGPGGNRLLLAVHPDHPDFTDVSTTPGAPTAVRADGAVGVLLEGVDVRTVVSQGCRPIGRPFVVTRASGNRVEELGGRRALDRLQDCAAEASLDEIDLIRHGVHVGIVVDEHRADFGPGDFLVRDLTGADPATGTLVISDDVSVGQTVQFHVRDAIAADAELHELLTGVEASAALLFSCTERGTALFGVPDHDASLVDRLLGPLPLAGAGCAGEIGPIGGRNFVHTFTASLALFGP
jgi:small ligand-binding sensory domain FIST